MPGEVQQVDVVVVVAFGRGEHVAPRGGRRLHAEAEERQGRLGDDRRRDAEGGVDEDRADAVREDVAGDDARVRRAAASAASTNSFSFTDNTCPRTTRATYIQPSPASTRMMMSSV